MKHGAALVLLLTIAATPVTTFLCVASCAPESMPATASCHHHAQSSTPVNVTADDDPCAQLLAIRPFVKEDVQPIAGQVLLASAPPAFIVAPGEAWLVAVREVAAAVPHRAATSPVLRL